MRQTTRTIAALALLVSLGAPRAVLAQAEAAAVPQHSGTVEFLSGGVGETELAQMKAQASGYNLKVLTATPSGAYLGSADLTIADAQGRRILSTRTLGPLFYARLPAGRYVVTARSGAQVQEKTVRVGAGASPELTFTLAAPEDQAPNRAGTATPEGRARVEDKGVSLYDLDPGAADRARTQVNRYEVYPDGTMRALGPNEVLPGGRSVDGDSGAATIHVAPVEPGTVQPASPGIEPAPAPGTPPPY
jgi:hypothetical protein